MFCVVWLLLFELRFLGSELKLLMFCFLFSFAFGFLSFALSALNSTCVLVHSAFFWFLPSHFCFLSFALQLFWAQECSVPKKINIFTACLSSRVLSAQENHYVYRVIELKNAACPRQPLYLPRFRSQDFSVPKKTAIFRVRLSSRVLRAKDKYDFH